MSYCKGCGGDERSCDCYKPDFTAPSHALAGAQATGNEQRTVVTGDVRIVHAAGDALPTVMVDWHGNDDAELSEERIRYIVSLCGPPDAFAADLPLLTQGPAFVRRLLAILDAERASRLSDDDRRAAFMAGYRGSLGLAPAGGTTYYDSEAEREYAAWLALLAQRPEAQR